MNAVEVADFGDIIATLTRQSLYLATAESLTAGLVSAAIVDVPGASKVFLGSAVVYTNSVKQHLLGVSGETLELHGAVSAQTAEEMARSARGLLSAAGGVELAKTIAISTTGVAGPDADGDHQPGEVFIAIADQHGDVHIEHLQLPGSRAEIRQSTVAAVARLLRSLLAK